VAEVSDDDDKNTVTQIIDRMAINAGLDDDDRKTLRDTMRDNTAAGKDYKAVKAWLWQTFKLILSKWYTYPLLASGSGGVAYFFDLINAVD